MPSDKKSIKTRVDPDLKQEFKDKTNEQGVSQSDALEELVRRYVADEIGEDGVTNRDLMDKLEEIQTSGVPSSSASSSNSSTASSMSVSGALTEYDADAEVPDDMTPHGEEDVLSKDALQEFATVMKEDGIYAIPELDPEHLIRKERPQGDENRVALAIALLARDNHLVDREDVVDVLTDDDKLDYTPQYVTDKNAAEQVLDKLVEYPRKDSWIVSDQGREFAVDEALKVAREKVAKVANPEGASVSSRRSDAVDAVEELERLEDATGYVPEHEDLREQIDRNRDEGVRAKVVSNFRDAVDDVESVASTVENGTFSRKTTISSVDKAEVSLTEDLPGERPAQQVRHFLGDVEVTEDELVAFESRLEDVRELVSERASEARERIHGRHQELAQYRVMGVEHMVAWMQSWVDDPSEVRRPPWLWSVLNTAVSDAEEFAEVCGCIDVEFEDYDGLVDDFRELSEKMAVEAKARNRREQDRVVDEEMNALIDAVQAAEMDSTDAVWDDVADSAKAAYKAAPDSHRDTNVVQDWVADLVDSVERLRMDERDRETKPMCLNVGGVERGSVSLRARMDDADVETESA